MMVIIMLKIFMCFMLNIITVYSYASCSTADVSANSHYDNTIAIQGGTYSVGEDSPIGSVIRIQRIIGLRDVNANCTGNITPLIYGSGGVLYSGQTDVWQTGVSGLGVRFKHINSGQYVSSNVKSLSSLGSTQAIFSANSMLAYDIEFVKMGPIDGGSVTTASFPVIVIDASDGDGIDAWASRGYYSGSFLVQIPTCTTPSWTWDLGSMTVNQQYSLWKDTPVTLRGCPTFNGNNSNGSLTQYTMTGSESGTILQLGSQAPINVNMQLTALTRVIDTSSGIVSLDSNSTASGFGVQIGITQNGSYTAQSLDDTINIIQEVGSSRGTIIFPIAARMVKINDAAIAGSISTSMTYTINYQ